MSKQRRDRTIFEVERCQGRISSIERVPPFHETRECITTSQLLCM